MTFIPTTTDRGTGAGVFERLLDLTIRSAIDAAGRTVRSFAPISRHQAVQRRRSCRVSDAAEQLRATVLGGTGLLKDIGAFLPGFGVISAGTSSMDVLKDHRAVLANYLKHEERDRIGDEFLPLAQ